MDELQLIQVISVVVYIGAGILTIWEFFIKATVYNIDKLMAGYEKEIDRKINKAKTKIS